MTNKRKGLCNKKSGKEIEELCRREMKLIDWDYRIITYYSEYICIVTRK